MSSKNYNELMQLYTFEERLEYLKLSGNVGEITFGFDRYLNQNFYHSTEWRKFRRDIIERDGGYDLGIDGMNITGKVFIHHIEPIFPEDIIDSTDILLNRNNVITCSLDTHNIIHYGYEIIKPKTIIIRKPNDTCPWKK